MKIKTIQIRIEKNAKEQDLDDYLRSENYTIENTFASLKEDDEGSFWEVLILYKESLHIQRENKSKGSKEDMYDELVNWVEKKAIEMGKNVEYIENTSRVYQIAEDYTYFYTQADFLKLRNYGEKKFKTYGKDILEIFRRYR